ncbi:hypothetical protein HZS_1914 [Henneguya salminicola]|nr:hypothetical protein HZS_1914 [Henneguya salminicola]
MYLTVFHELIVLPKYSWIPQSLIMLLFPSKKKAIERKLKKCKVFEHNCRIIFSKIELLTIVTIQEIPNAIRYVNSLTTVQPELISFWSYFDLIWRRRFEQQLWNISNINDIDIAGRTNNALKSITQRCTEIRQNSNGIVYQSEPFSMPEIDL